MNTPQDNYKWWQKGIIYEIYIRSFKDGNGDGTGDIRGIIDQLDYLAWLGINAIWITPFYPSPMKDFGYDIVDYTTIDPLFGQEADLEELVTLAHSKNIKLILDIVPNHTSSMHPWFIESASSKDNPKRNWYIWKDALPDGSEPNNWLAMFGGSAWEWNEPTQQYYYHAFLKEQPDLNWRNPEVHEAMLRIFRYWLDKGIDGFRLDGLWHLIKDELFRDNPANPDYNDSMPDVDRLKTVYSTDQPEIHAVIKKIRTVLDEYENRMMIGEVYLPVEKLMDYYGLENDGIHLPFNFQLLLMDWDAQKIGLAIDQYEAALPAQAWPNWVISNHDRPRVPARIGKEQLRNAALLLLTLRGTPTIYYGDEIGMDYVPIPEEEIVDPQGLNMPGKNLSRDPSRTPMQWDETINAGFTTGKPWLRIGKNQHINVKKQQADKSSLLQLYKQIIDLRSKEPSLQAGTYLPVSTANGVLVYKREKEGCPGFLIAINCSHQAATVAMPSWITEYQLVLKTDGYKNVRLEDGNLYLDADSGAIFRKGA